MYWVLDKYPHSGGLPLLLLSALQLLPEVVLRLGRLLGAPDLSWLLLLLWGHAACMPGRAAGLPYAHHAQVLRALRGGQQLLGLRSLLLPAGHRLLRMLLLQLEPQRCHVPRCRRGRAARGLHWLWQRMRRACIIE